MNECKQYMTLRELQHQIGSTAGKKTPTAKWLREHSIPADVYESDDYQITVYKNGFAAVISGHRRSVIRMDRCGGYNYSFDNWWLEGAEDATTHRMEADDFLDLPWPIRIVMMAEDQLEENGNTRERRLLSKHPEIPDDRNWMNGGFSRPTENEVIRGLLIEEILDRLTDKQRAVMVAYYIEGYTQEEIGKRLGISKVAVSERLKAAEEKMKRPLMEE